MKKKIILVLVAAVLSLGLIACGNKDTVNKTNSSREEGQKVIASDDNETTVSGGALADEENQAAASNAEKPEEMPNDKSETSVVSDRTYYSTVKISDSVPDAYIYGLGNYLNGHGSYSDYNSELILSYDTTTGKVIGGRINLYYPCNNIIGDPKREMEEGLLTAPGDISGHFSNFTTTVIERGDSDAPLIECLSADVDVTSGYWANLNQYINIYLVEGVQNVDGLKDHFVNRGASEVGDNYVGDKFATMYEWY